MWVFNGKGAVAAPRKDVVTARRAALCVVSDVGGEMRVHDEVKVDGYGVQIYEVRDGEVRRECEDELGDFHESLEETERLRVKNGVLVQLLRSR